MNGIIFEDLINIEKLLEEGNIIISRCQCKKNNEKYLLKKVKRDSARNPCRPFEIEGQVYEEVKILTEIHHENLLNLINMKVDNDYSYFLYENVNFFTLADYLNKFGIITLEEMKEIIKFILNALYAFHEKGVSFKDMRSSNVLIVTDINDISKIRLSQIKIKLSSLFSEQHLNRYSILLLESSKFAYFAPEILKHNKATTESDIWSVGVLVYTMITKNFPFGYTLKEVLNNIKKGDYTFNKSHLIPIDCLHFISSCLRKDPNKRSNVQELIEHPFIQKTSCPSLKNKIPYSFVSQEEKGLLISLSCNPERVTILIKDDPTKIEFISEPYEDNKEEIKINIVNYFAEEKNLNKKLPPKDASSEGIHEEEKEEGKEKEKEKEKEKDEKEEEKRHLSPPKIPFGQTLIAEEKMEFELMEKTSSVDGKDTERYVVDTNKLNDEENEYLTVSKIPNLLIVVDLKRYREYYLSLVKNYIEFPVMSLSKCGLYLSGGISSFDSFSNKVELINISIYPFNYEFEVKTTLCYRRSGHCAVTINLGDLCIIGGYNEYATMKNCEIYNRSEDSVLRICSLNIPRKYAGSCLFSNLNASAIYVFGGWTNTNNLSNSHNLNYLNNLDSIEVLNFGETLIWKKINYQLPSALCGLGCRQYKDHGIVIFGGINSEGKFENFFYKLFPNPNSKQKIKRLEKKNLDKMGIIINQQFLHSTVALFKQKVFFFGHLLNILYHYDLNDKKVHQEPRFLSS